MARSISVNRDPAPAPRHRCIIGVAVPYELKARLLARAHAEDLTLSQLMRRLLQQY